MVFLRQKERIKIIHDAFKKVLEMPDFQRRITELGAEIDYLGSSDFAKFLKDQDKLWFRIIKAGGFGIAK
jgi:tripartite-type tricarboxylate transporter receptor subunit TctC